jgi:hypothetical protein
VSPIASEILNPVCVRNSKNNRHCAGSAASSSASSARVSALACSSSGSPPVAAGMRTPCTGLERSNRSSTAVANIADSAARRPFTVDGDTPSSRSAENNSRTSAGSRSASRHVPHRRNAR